MGCFLLSFVLANGTGGESKMFTSRQGFIDGNG